MAGDGASEINLEQVMAAASERNRAVLRISQRIAAGPHPLPEQCLAELRMTKRAISAEVSDLCAVLRGLRLGDFAFMEELPPGRLDELLGVRTDRVARPRGVPLDDKLMIETTRRAFKLALEMPIPLRSSSAGVAMAAPGATPSARGGHQMDATIAEVNRDAAAAAPVQSACEGLARLQIDELPQSQWRG